MNRSPNTSSFKKRYCKLPKKETRTGKRYGSDQTNLVFGIILASKLSNPKGQSQWLNTGPINPSAQVITVIVPIPLFRILSVNVDLQDGLASVLVFWITIYWLILQMSGTSTMGKPIIVKDRGLLVETQEGIHIAGLNTFSSGKFEKTEVSKILETLKHKAKGNYNRWSASRDKKNTFSYEEVMEALKRL